MFQRAKKYFFPIFINLLFLSAAFSQVSIQNQENSKFFRQGESYFKEKNYIAAKNEFNQYLSKNSELDLGFDAQIVRSEYFINLSNLYLNQSNAEISAQRFIKKYSSLPESRELMRKMGLFFYDKANFEKAIQYLEFSADNHTEATYKLAMSYYELKDFEKALVYFESIVDSEQEEYSFNAAYYAGVLNFKDGNFDLAIKDFKKAEGNSKYREEIPNWIGLSYFNQNKYQELIKYAEPIVSNPSSIYKIDELVLLLAQVEYKLNQFEAASKNFEKAFNLVPKSKTPETSFQYGYSLFKLNQYSRSIEELEELAIQKDSLAQLAAYTLALANLESNRKNESLEAFGISKELNFNPSIQEESKFNYAKLLFDLNRIEDCLINLGDFNKEYSNSEYLLESYNIARNAILKLNNIQIAENYLKTVNPSNSDLNLAYQQLAYSLGVNSYKNKDYEKSLKLMNLAIEQNHNLEITNLAIFAKGEIYSQRNQYLEAIKIYENLINAKLKGENSEELIQEVRLSLAYAYFSLKNFEKANALFKIYIDELVATNNVSKKANVILRLADTYLISKKYQDALNYYQQAYKQLSEDKDYALYQIGLCFNYLNRGNEAISSFKKLKAEFPNSKYINDALYQENLIAFNNRQYKESIAGFTYIIKNLKNHPNYFDALLYRAQANINLRNHETAIEELNEILEKYPKEDIAKDALYALQEELNMVGKSDEFDEILKNYKQNSGEKLSQEETEELAYNSVKNTYLSEKFANSIEPMMRFNQNYPESKYADELTYNIADAAYRAGRKEIARDFYNKFLENNPKDENAKKYWEIIAQLSYELEDYEFSIYGLKNLKKQDLNPEDLLKANNGLVNSYLKLNNIDSASKIANDLIQLPNIKNQEKSQLAIRMAEIYEKDSLNHEKEEYWLENTIKNDSSGNNGAKAQLRLAQKLYDAGKYQTSIDMVIEKFQNDFAEADEILVAKAFILLAENFVGLGNRPQAIATLNSIMENSENEEIKNLAKEKLDEINLETIQKTEE